MAYAVGVDQKWRSEFTNDELKLYREQFNAFDADSSGSITTSELGQIMDMVGERTSDSELRKIIAEVDVDQNGTVEARRADL